MMKFDTDNEIVKLCAEGMALEVEGRSAEASHCFQQVWHLAATNFEKFTSSHYFARHQDTIADKLNGIKWRCTSH